MIAISVMLCSCYWKVFAIHVKVKVSKVGLSSRFDHDIVCFRK